MSKQKVPWGIGIILLDGPLTVEEIKAEAEKYPFASSMGPSQGRRQTRQRYHADKVTDNLAELIQAGWVIKDGDRYTLTTLGSEQANQAKEEAISALKMVSHKIRSLTQPENASKVTLIVQIMLAVIKLPAGLLSGSIGLLNDSVDTILDLLSSLLVYLGIRFNKERLVSILLVVFMLATGGFTLYEAVQRFFTAYVPQVDWFPFLATLLSAIAGLVLWTYQRYVGIQYGLMAFITESVDSRNHVIVALGVTAGLIASLLRFSLLDMLVGLVVALLILWSAIELVIDLVRSSTDGQVDLTRYGFWLQGVYEDARKGFLRNSALYLVESQQVRTKPELLERLQRFFDFRDNPWMKAVGLDRQIATDALIEQTLDEIIQSGWVIDKEPLILSEEGKNYLNKPNRRHRRGGLSKKII